MRFSEFRRLVQERHGHAKYALVLFMNRLDINRIFVAKEIPCIAACMLRYDLPVAVKHYISLTAG